MENCILLVGAKIIWFGIVELCCLILEYILKLVMLYIILIHISHFIFFLMTLLAILYLF